MLRVFLFIYLPLIIYPRHSWHMYVFQEWMNEWPLNNFHEEFSAHYVGNEGRKKDLTKEGRNREAVKVRRKNGKRKDGRGFKKEHQMRSYTLKNKSAFCSLCILMDALNIYNHTLSDGAVLSVLQQKAVVLVYVSFRQHKTRSQSLVSSVNKLEIQTVHLKVHNNYHFISTNVKLVTPLPPPLQHKKWKPTKHSPPPLPPLFLKKKRW